MMGMAHVKASDGTCTCGRTHDLKAERNEALLAEVERLQKIVETERPSYVRVCKELRESKAEVERLRAELVSREYAEERAVYGGAIERLEAEVERLKATEEAYHKLLPLFYGRGDRIEAALALHVEIEGQWKAKVCRECSGMYSVAYPCPTVKALTGGRA